MKKITDLLKNKKTKFRLRTDTKFFLIGVFFLLVSKLFSFFSFFSIMFFLIAIFCNLFKIGKSASKEVSELSSDMKKSINEKKELVKRIGRGDRK